MCSSRNPDAAASPHQAAGSHEHVQRAVHVQPPSGARTAQSGAEALHLRSGEERPAEPAAADSAQCRAVRKRFQPVSRERSRGAGVEGVLLESTVLAGGILEWLRSANPPAAAAI